MRITKNQLKRLIKEEARKLNKQGFVPAPMKSRASAEFARAIKSSNIKENLYGPGGRERWEDYRRQHVAELAEILEMYPDMAESESDLREYWEGVIHDALKLAFM
jgi:hypothetical protein